MVNLRDAFPVYNLNELRNSIEDDYEDTKSHFDKLELGNEFAQPEDPLVHSGEGLEVTPIMFDFEPNPMPMQQTATLFTVRNSQGSALSVSDVEFVNLLPMYLGAQCLGTQLLCLSDKPITANGPHRKKCGTRHLRLDC